MCDFTVNFGGLAEEHGFPTEIFDLARAQLDALAEEGLAEVSDRTVSMTPVGRPFVRLARRRSTPIFQLTPHVILSRSSALEEHKGSR